MSEVAQTLLDEFGRAVKRARSLKGWTLDQVAGCITPAPGKSFLSNIEKGKRSIGVTTVGKLITALDLAEAWIDRFLDVDIAPEDEETRQDRDADRLLRLVAADPTAPETPEVLLMLLAEEWAGSRFTNPMDAYNALKAALQAAADMRAQGALPSNSSAQLQAVLRRVSELNDAGQLDEADAALQDAAARHDAEGEALFEVALKQDRLRNRPAEAAKRLVKRLRAEARPEGLFTATHNLLHEWRIEGMRLADTFRLRVARELARLNNHEKGPRRAPCLFDTANCQFSLGERSADLTILQAAARNFTAVRDLKAKQSDWLNWSKAQRMLGVTLRVLGDREGNSAHLKHAIAAFKAALTISGQEDAPLDWAAGQNGLGTALRALAVQTGETVYLHQSIAAYQEALTVHTRTACPQDWAGNHNNLGVALCRLGSLEGCTPHFDAAQIAYDNCLTLHRKADFPFSWAQTQWNLADLALARNVLLPAPDLPCLAQTHLDLAREVFAAMEDSFQLAECDRLQAQIDAA